MLRTLKYKSRLFEEIETDFGFNLDKVNKSEHFKTYRCRTSNVQPFIVLKKGKGIIVEDFRFYEYSIAFALALKGLSIDENIFGDWSSFAGHISRSLIVELMYNQNEDYVADFYYQNYFKNSDISIFDILPTLVDKDLYKNDDFSIYVNKLPLLVRGHESQHFWFHFDRENEQKKNTKLLKGVLDIARKIKAGNDPDLAYLENQANAVSGFFSHLTNSTVNLKGVSEEIVCDLTMLNKTFHLFVQELEKKEMNKSYFIFKSIEAHILHLHVLYLTEYTRMRVFRKLDKEEEEDEFFRVMNTRLCYVILGCVFILNDLNIESSVVKDIMEKVLETNALFFEKNNDILNDIFNKTHEDIIESWHNMAMDVVEGNDLDLKEIKKEIDKIWKARYVIRK